MSYKIPRGATHAILQVLVEGHNQQREEAIASNIHADTTPAGDVDDFNDPSFDPLTVTGADGTDLATGKTLGAEVKAVLNAHYADMFAHDTVETAAITTAAATNEATLVTLANALKGSYEAHRSASDVHFNNDSTNTITAATATDTATANVMLNELKEDVTAHIAAAMAGGCIELIG